MPGFEELVPSTISTFGVSVWQMLGLGILFQMENRL